LNFLRWIKRFTGQQTSDRQSQRYRRRLMAQVLEDRITPTMVNWINNAGGDWDTASNWSPAQVPGAGDDAVISQTGITITHSTGASDSVNSVQCSATLSISSGTLSIASASSISALTESAGTLTGAGTVTVTGLMTWSGGTMSGTGITNINGGTALGGNFTTLSGRTLNNPGTVTVSGNSGYYLTISNGAVVNNLSGATWDYHNDAAINSSGTATFNNAGTFEKTAGTDNTQVLPLFTNTGTVNADSGNFSFTGGAVTIGGSGFLTSEPGTTISFTGNLLGSTQNADQFNPEGNILLDGSGSSSSPQHLEAMSQDLGAVAAGFTSNFVYNTLTIGGSD